MRKKIFVTILTLALLTSLTLSFTSVLAGNNNNNGDNGLQGTGKINHLDGCRPSTNAGNVWISIPSILPPWITTNIWEGAPCCAARSDGPIGEYLGEPLWMPNQCCNPPDEGPVGVPGNHCLCFQNRGWPVPNAGFPPI